MNLGFLHYKSLSQIFCHQIRQIDYARYDESDDNRFEGSRCNRVTHTVESPAYYFRPPISDLFIGFIVFNSIGLENILLQKNFCQLILYMKYNN